MDELESIDVFLKVVEAGSFSAAGRALDKSASAIARQVSWLEHELSVPLLKRNTRNQSLTESGKLYYERVTAISRDLKTAKIEIKSAHECAEGILRVSLRTTTATTVIVPALKIFFEKYPGIELEIEVTDERRDLISNNIDVAVWLGELADSDLVARQLAPNRRVLCASPEYLKQHGTPSSPKELVNHNCLIFTAKGYGNEWKFWRDSKDISVPVRGSIASANGLVLLEAAEHGIGLVVMQQWMVAELLRSGKLLRVLPEYIVGPSLSTAPIYAVFSSRRHLSRRVRLFVDFLVELFSMPAEPDIKSEKDS